MKLIFPIIFFITYMVATATGANLGFTATSPFYTHITWMFMHGGWVHLGLNCFSFYVMFRAVERFIHPWALVVVMITVCIASSYALHYTVPVVGASGMVYVLVGLYFRLIVGGKLVYPSKLAMVVGVSSVVLSIAISFYKSNSAAAVHLFCLIEGFIIGLVIKKLK